MQKEAGSGARPACPVGSRASSWLSLRPASSSPPRLQGHWALTQGLALPGWVTGGAWRALLGHRGAGVGSGEQEGLIRGHPAAARPPPSGSGAGTPQRPPHPPEELQGLQAVRGGTRPPEAQGVPSRGAAMTCQPGVRGPWVQERGTEATRDWGCTVCPGAWGTALKSASSSQGLGTSSRPRDLAA